MEITARSFFTAWVESVYENKGILLDFWSDRKPYTNCIIGNKDSIMRNVANKIGLLCYAQDYYSIDCILYKAEDRYIVNENHSTFWFKDIRVAFEHEHIFNKELYKEITHLLITKSQLKVIVSYPNGDYLKLFDEFHKIIKSSLCSGVMSENKTFLFILGYKNNFEWKGFIYNSLNWIKI